MLGLVLVLHVEYSQRIERKKTNSPSYIYHWSKDSTNEAYIRGYLTFHIFQTFSLDIATKYYECNFQDLRTSSRRINGAERTWTWSVTHQGKPTYHNSNQW